MTDLAGVPIDVWFMNLDDIAARRGGLLGTLLLEDEHARAAGFLARDTRRRFVAGREMLRMILGRQCDLAPTDVVFESGPNGKPSVSPRSGRNTFFCVAHCGEFGVVAVTDLGDVGVDIERVRNDVDVNRVASRLFPAEESRRLVTLPGAERARAFFEGWVREEALVKATGTRLSSLWASHGGVGAQVPNISRTGPDTSWTLCGFSPARDVIGCVAVRAPHPIRVRLRSVAELEVTRSA